MDLSVCYSGEYLPDCEQAVVYRDGCVPVLFNFRGLGELRLLCHQCGVGAELTDLIVEDVKLCRRAASPPLDFGRLLGALLLLPPGRRWRWDCGCLREHARNGKESCHEEYQFHG